MIATQKQVKNFLKEINAMDFYDENPGCEVVSYGKDTHLVLADPDGDTIHVFITRRYTWVESTMEVWSKCVWQPDEAMAAYHIWLTA